MLIKLICFGRYSWSVSRNIRINAVHCRQDIFRLGIALQMTRRII